MHGKDCIRIISTFGDMISFCSIQLKHIVGVSDV